MNLEVEDVRVEIRANSLDGRCIGTARAIGSATGGTIEVVAEVEETCNRPVAVGLGLDGEVVGWVELPPMARGEIFQGRLGSDI